MSQEVRVGTMLIDERPAMVEALGLQNERYSGSWSLVKLDGLAFDRKVHAAGWSFFFMAAEIKVMFWGALGAKKIQNALHRIAGQVKGQDFNCLEITGIVARRFLGVPYAVITAHSRHVQQSYYLESATARRASQ